MNKKIRKFFLFGRYCGVPFREYLTYEEIKNNYSQSNEEAKK